MVFAVDFDGTLSFGQWPECGPGNNGLIEFLKKRKNDGDKLILWTCREGSDLSAAVDWCLDKAETLEKLVKSGQKKFVRYEEGKLLYSMGLHSFQEIAKEAGAVYHVKRMVLVNVEKVDRYLENFCDEL